MYDAIVIGGGPAGAITATRLARHGRSVLIVEREPFPRFHIGESLLPCSMTLFESLGIGAALGRAGFLPKHAAEFVTEDGTLRRRYRFADSMLPGPPTAFEVDRASFDDFLLRQATEAGADLLRAEARSVDLDGPDAITVRVRDADGERDLSARVLVDASGQRSLVAAKLELRKMDLGLKNFAVFSHFEGAMRASGAAEGDISVVLVPGGWWWVIPLAGDRTSLGLVGPARLLGGKKPDEAFFAARMARSSYLVERFAGARRVAPVRTTSDFSYTVRRLAGDRWLLVGDAAGFVDPVFSTGVHLAARGGVAAADAVHMALSRGDCSRRAFLGYERSQQRAIATYRRFVKGFYTPELVDLLMHPSDWLDLRRAVTSLLAGHVDSFSVGWRIGVFRTLAWMNRRWSLTPRLKGRRDVTGAVWS